MKQSNANKISRHVPSTLAVLFVTACSGGSGGDSTPPPPPPPPPPALTISVTDASVDEGDSGSVDLLFTVTLSGAAGDVTSVDFATADSSAVAGDDYVAVNGTMTIPIGDLSANIVVPVNGDVDPESDEELTLTLSNPSTNVTLGIATAVGRIRNDDAGPVPLLGAELNDTGVTACANGLNVGLACNDAVLGTADYPEQDAQHGRDVTANADLDGHAGFAFTKLDAAGAILSEQSADYSITPWECVRDNVTGLVWEVKKTDATLHDANWTYSWYDDSGFNALSGTGDADLGTCDLELHCDTAKFAARVNTVGLCGYSDWRLPTRPELVSIIHYGRTSAPFIDVGYFPNASAKNYWSASPGFVGAPWAVDLSTGDSAPEWPFEDYAVRLVRGGF